MYRLNLEIKGISARASMRRFYGGMCMFVPGVQSGFTS